MTAPERIAVLGGGPMGLAVAYQLARDGQRPVVFEADDRIGGMTASFEFGDLEIERYYHFHCTSDSDLLTLLDELGISERMNWVSTRMAYWHGGRLQPWGNPIALLRFRGLSWHAKLRYGLHVMGATRRRNWRPLDSLHATRWVQRWVGAEAYEVLWRRLFELKFHHHSDRLSAAWIWGRVSRVGTSRDDAFREKLGYLDGGTVGVLRAMRHDIEKHGGEVRLGSPVNRVVVTDGAVCGVQTNGAVESFDKVISTVPLPYVPRIIPDLPAENIAGYRSIDSMAVVCVIAKLRKPVSENFWINTSDPDMDVPGFVEYSNLRPMSRPLVYVPFYLPPEHAMYAEPDSSFITKVTRYLSTINPQLAAGDFMDFNVSRYLRAQPICEPGHLDRLPPIATPIRGLWVADTAYYYPQDRAMSESIRLGRSMAREAGLS
ncbi:NAD(P)/FAD-dependent oxidoreductase [Smaragdicoccus niigatensis]|uniref:NAD(P)/FAD-dependent oxidoreductase n=1 Tax=Smaragdicoccus niigatensis TaxID=359359 RepID=UPI00035C69B4|nr:NAD(P)/FAD-dependent oxidoreductase [Smaragdicoccus niigatensis]